MQTQRGFAVLSKWSAWVAEKVRSEKRLKGKGRGSQADTRKKRFEMREQSKRPRAGPGGSKEVTVAGSA